MKKSIMPVMAVICLFIVATISGCTDPPFSIEVVGEGNTVYYNDQKLETNDSNQGNNYGPDNPGPDKKECFSPSGTPVDCESGLPLVQLTPTEGEE